MTEGLEIVSVVDTFKLKEKEGLRRTTNMSGRENRLYRAGRTPTGGGTRARTV